MLEIMKIKDDYDSCVAGHFGDVGKAEFLYMKFLLQQHQINNDYIRAAVS